ncbi:TrbI/VirB10 family protein, partial [Yersinia kristensenii]|uniref:TrbI/VirB10 family protein n=1 Tax=Yersinia kristensenii TaxID=28152 RepID=UPI000CC062F7
IPATLISGINSDLPGQVIAQVNQNVYDTATHSTILLPQGSKLYGVYDSRVAYGQDRLLMAWTRINFPDGTTLELEGMGGTDAAGYAGFADQVDHHYFKIFGNAFLLGLISGATQSGVSDNNSDNVSTSESVNNGVVQQFSTVGTSLIQKNLDVQPTIKIRNGYKFNVMLNKDVVLPPYQPSH